MEKKAYEDIILILYLLPFLVSFSASIYFWSQRGFDPILFREVYLLVTENIILFFLGLVGVLLALTLALLKAGKKIKREADKLRMVALLSLFFSFLFGLIATNFSLDAFLALIFQGRYALIFPFTLLALSYLLSLSKPLNLKLNYIKALSIILFFLSLISLYLLWKINFNFFITLIAALSIYILGLFLSFLSWAKA